MKENKNKVFNDLKSNSQHRAWVILGAYFIFFMVIILSIRSNGDKLKENEDTNTNIYSIEKIKNSNYHFKYSIDLDNNIIVYEGDKTKVKEKFSKTKAGVVENYYMENNIYLKYENNNYINSNDPYEVITFKDPEVLNKILSLSKYVSKTEYEDKTKLYNYQISTTTLVKILDLERIDIADEVNKIKVYIDNSNQVTKLEFDFTPYFIYKGMTTTKGYVVMEYTNFNKIGNLEK